jgi:iron complex outermembrane receptor protein
VTAGNFKTYSAYVDSVYPAILNQPATLTASIHELRASSARDTPFSWTVGLYSEVRDDHIDSQVAHVDPLTGSLQPPVARADRPPRHR